MKMLKSRKALSPVVASIILIAVTVAVSLAVAIWMGALTTGFMGTEELRITKLQWGSNNSEFTLTVNNTGTKDITITQIQVNYATISGVSGLPKILHAGEGWEFTVQFAYTNGTKYDISVVTQSGHKFTDQFIGGINKE